MVKKMAKYEYEKIDENENVITETIDTELIDNDSNKPWSLKLVKKYLQDVDKSININSVHKI